MKEVPRCDGSAPHGAPEAIAQETMCRASSIPIIELPPNDKAKTGNTLEIEAENGLKNYCHTLRSEVEQTSRREYDNRREYR